MTLDKLLIFVNYIANKVMSGNTYSIPELNANLPIAQQKHYNNVYSQFQRTKKITDSLQVFLSNNTITVDSSGQYILPTNYNHCTGLGYIQNVAGTNYYRPIKEITSNKYMSRMGSSLLQPTTKYPIALFLGGTVQYGCGIAGGVTSTLSNMVLSGVTSQNTDNYKLYWGTSSGSGPIYDVTLYKNIAKAAGDRVAYGYISAVTGTVTLSQVNTSGMSGTVELSFTSEDNDTANIVNIYTNSNTKIIQFEPLRSCNVQFSYLRYPAVPYYDYYIDENDNKIYKNQGDAQTVILKGDYYSQLSNLYISGVTEVNSNSGILYYNISTGSGPIYEFTLYKASTKVAGDLVAYGYRSSVSGAINFTQLNYSGISGSVTINYSHSDVDSANYAICLSNSQTLELEWRQEDQMKIVGYLLEMIGINLKDDAIFKYAKDFNVIER
jgi:hypothetical protein